MSQQSPLAVRILVALETGSSRKEVVEELVAEGFSRAGAERLVDRALDEPALPVRSMPRAVPREAAEARRTLVSGALWIVLGAAILLGGFSAVRHIQWERRRAFEAQRLDAARAFLEDARAAEQRQVADAARERQHQERVSRSLDHLRTSSRPTTLCDAALDLGQAGAREAIPELLALLERRTEHVSARNCAASALVTLGETPPALAFYLECAQAWTSDCRRIAIGGFGDIGPEAFDVSLPYVRQALQSSDSGLRYIAVDALSKMGPAAEPLLRDATRDLDPNVREHAARALER